MASQWRPLRDTLRTLRSGSPSPSCVHPLCARDPSLLSTLHLDFVYPPSLPTSAPLLPLTLHPPPHFHPRLPRYHPARIYAPAFPLPFPSPILFLLPGPISLSPHLHGRSLSLHPAPLPSSLRLFFSFVQVTLISCAINLSRSKLDLGRYVFTRYYFRPLLHRIDDDVAGSSSGATLPRDDGEPTSYPGPDSWKIYRILVFR